jgi:hypothetical protein
MQKKVEDKFDPKLVEVNKDLDGIRKQQKKD